jgi:hypothetical protein
MGLQAAVQLVHMPWALMKEEEEVRFKSSFYQPVSHQPVHHYWRGLVSIWMYFFSWYENSYTNKVSSLSLLYLISGISV